MQPEIARRKYVTVTPRIPGHGRDSCALRQQGAALTPEPKEYPGTGAKIPRRPLHSDAGASFRLIDAPVTRLNAPPQSR